MRRYIITYRNRKGEILSQKTFAKNQANALQRLRLESFEILAITKLNKKLGDKL